MTEYICNLTLEKLLDRKVIIEEDKDIYRYGLQLLIATILKGVGLILVGIWTGMLIEFIVFVGFFSSLRTQAGGYHAKTVAGCFIGTLAMVLLSTNLIKLIPINFQVFYILFSLAIVFALIYIYAPKDSSNKPLSQDEKTIYRHKSLKVTIFGSIFILLFAILGDSSLYFSMIGSTGFLLESLTIIPPIKLGFR